MTADEIIERLSLRPHPEEGGYFRETYRSDRVLPPGPEHPGERSLATAIYYLLTPATFSELHRLPGDEVFHFYLGDPVEMLLLGPEGRAETVLLGPDLVRMKVQHVVPGGVWQGSRLLEGGAWALLGTTMSPGFDYADYERGTPALLERYPDARDRIEALLRR